MQNAIIEELQKLSEDNFTIENGQAPILKCIDFLMNGCVLKTSTKLYRLVEIEFYKYSRHHPDCFCHCREGQLTLGHWYFHSSGVDITFGKKDTSNKERHVFGGLLIRGIKEVKTGAYTSGPLNAVREIMGSFGSVTEPNQVLQLIVDNSINYSELRCTTRIGLPVKSEVDFPEAVYFRNAPYRFVADINDSRHRYREKEKVRSSTDTI